MRPPRTRTTPAHTINQLAELFGVADTTMRQWLRDVDPDVKPDGTYGKRWCVMTVVQARWLTAQVPAGETQVLDLTAERARLAAEQADRQSMINAAQRGELAPIDYYSEAITNYTSAMASAWDAVPMQLRQRLPHLTQIDHATIETIFADERGRLADRLASGAFEDGEDPGGSSGLVESPATAAAE